MMPARTRHARRRLVRPPSKQILQLREGEDGAGNYDGLTTSPRPGRESSSRSNATDKRANSSSSLTVSCNGEDSGADADTTAAAGRRVHSSSLPSHHTSTKHHDNESDNDSAAVQRGTHLLQRATTTSARRDGKSTSTSANGHGPRSASSRASPAVSRSSLHHDQNSCSHSGSSADLHPTHALSRRPSSYGTPLATQQSGGGYASYYGALPVTAAVSPTQSSPSLVVADSTSASTAPTQWDSTMVSTTTSRTVCTAEKQRQQTPGHQQQDRYESGGNVTTTTTEDREGHAHRRGSSSSSSSSSSGGNDVSGDAGRADPWPPTSRVTSAFGTCDSSRAAAVMASPDTLHSYTSNADNSRTTADQSTTSCCRTQPSTATGKSNGVPLTYAAVVSASSTPSSLHGKRLPQSRVGFGNFRKRVGGAGNNSGTTSAASTARSTQGSPSMACSPSLFTDVQTGNSYVARCCASSCGFPSVPLTPLTSNPVDPAHLCKSEPRTMERDSLPSSMFAVARNGCGDGDLDADEGGGDAGNKDNDGESDGDSKTGTSHTTRELHPPQQSRPQQMMTPIPPSLHRNHPRNMFLQLPHQHAQSLDSDEMLDAESTVDARVGCNEQGGDDTACRAPLPAQLASAHSPSSTLSMQACNCNEGSSCRNNDAKATAAAPLPQSAVFQEELNRCQTSSMMPHTGPAVAAKAAAGLHLQPISAPIMTPSTSCVLDAPTWQRHPAVSPPQLQQQQQQQPAAAERCSTDVFNHYGGGSEATPTGPAPPTISNGKGMHRVSSTATFFSAAEIFPGLFLGSYGDAMSPEVLASHGISLVINCSIECPVTAAMANNPNHVRYVQCPLRDHSDEAISPFFTPVTQIIHEQLHRRQIHHQRRRKSAAVGTAGSAATTGNGCGGGGGGGVGACCPTSSVGTPVQTNSGVTTTTPMLTADAGQKESDEAGDMQQDRMLWTWADEADNVWAVPNSPSSPPLSVGGQPSLKEGKRETPRTPSMGTNNGNNASNGTWGRNSDGNASLSTSGSPSPMPGRTATFPVVSVGNAANTFAATPTPTSTSTPLTVVDPRDCGGVLVHCRMGVSRSATFVMAYLILYGFTLAVLEDTASLFVCFLERERCIIEEAGGRARFPPDGPATAHTPTINTNLSSSSSNNNTATPTSTNGGQNCTFPLSQSGTFFRSTAASQSGRLSAAVFSPTGFGSLGGGSGGVLTPCSTSPGGRRPPMGFTSWFSQRGSTVAPAGTTPTPTPEDGPTPPCRSAAKPITSPLVCINGSIASPQSTASSSQLRLYTPLMTPLEACSRVCRPCYLQRLRERRLQQQMKKKLLISGQQQQQQKEQEQAAAEEEEQRMALAAISRTRDEQQQQMMTSGSTCRFPTSSLEAEGRCDDCGDALMADSNGNNNVVCCRSLETTTHQRPCEHQQHQEPEQQLALYPTASSAPVVSHRGTRGGSFGMGRTLLQSAVDDEAARSAENSTSANPSSDNAEAERGEENSGKGRSTSRSGDDGVEAGVRFSTASSTPTFTVEKQRHDLRDSEEGGGGGGSSSSSSGVGCTAAAAAGPIPLRSTFSVSKASAAASVTQPRLVEASSNPLSTTHYSDFPLTACGGTAVSNRNGAAASTANNNNSDCSSGNFVFSNCDNSSTASSHSLYSADFTPAMTFREAFDAVKKQKPDVNPNIGFVLALRELAGGADFSFSTSL